MLFKNVLQLGELHFSCTRTSEHLSQSTTLSAVTSATYLHDEYGDNNNL